MDLFRPEDINTEIDTWISSALEYRKPKSSSDNFEQAFEKFSEDKQKLKDKILSFRETIKHYNLPFLSLPSKTSKDTALDVFINMNTNSKPLSQYDIIVAEIESLKDISLHEIQEQLEYEYPNISRYGDLSALILNTSALMQEKIPSRRGVWDMDRKLMIEKWDTMTRSLSRMTQFLEQHRIFDKERLPTNAILHVIAALYSHIPEN